MEPEHEVSVKGREQASILLDSLPTSKQDYYLAVSSSIELAFIRKCQSKSLLSINPTLLSSIPNSNNHYFIQQTLDQLLCNSESSKLLSGNSIRYISNQLIELIEQERHFLNNLIHLFETISTDPTINTTTTNEPATDALQLGINNPSFYKAIISKLRIAMFNQNEYLKMLKYTRQNILKIYKQCSKFNVKLIRKRDAIGRILRGSVERETGTGSSLPGNPSEIYF